MSNTTDEVRSAIAALAEHNPDAFYLLRDFVEDATAQLDEYKRRIEEFDDIKRRIVALEGDDR